MVMIIGTSFNDVVGKGYFTIGVSIPSPGFSGTTDLADTVLAGAGNDVIDGAGGNDLVMGEDGDDVLIGGLGNDILDGAAGDDTLLGGDGDDTLIAGVQGATGDILAGGTGDDTYVLVGSASIFEYENAGFDTVLADRRVANLQGGFAGHIEALTFMGLGDRIGNGNEYDNIITGATGNDTLSGHEGNDTVRGGDGGDDLRGGDGNDVLEGQDGQDILEGGAGIDILRGGAGDDVIVADRNDATIDGGAGFFDGLQYVLGTPAVNLNLAVGTASFAGGGGQSVIGIENALLTDFADTFTGAVGADIVAGGAGNDRVFGGAGDDNLAGQSGDDLLDGGLGADLLIGGLGNDIFFVDRTNDFITENAGEGRDLVDSTFSFALGAGSNLEDLLLLGTAALNGAGNELGNVIRGNTGNNVLRGGGGADGLRGGAGDDRLIGDDGQNVEFTVWNPAQGGNGHGYTVVSVPGGIDWNAAADAAQALGGTLASITSAEENSFVFGLADNSRYWSPDNVLGPWLGGAQPLAAQEPGEFRWVDGEAFNFTAWAPGEPSNGGGIEDRIQFFQRLAQPRSWNDQVHDSTGVVAYVVEFANPNAFNDFLEGGDGNDIIGGNLGIDRLIGGLGRDTLTGGSQRDMFDFNSALESTVGANRDVITDFQGAGAAGGDLIDLLGIDANSAIAGDQAFLFIGVGAFSGAGQVRIVASGANTIVAGNVDGDFAADFEIQLSGISAVLSPLIAGDFLL